MTVGQTAPGCELVRFEVLRCALAAAVDDMGVALQRSAYSSNIKTRGDFSCMFFDRHLRAAAQAFTQPIYLGGLFRLVPTVIGNYGSGPATRCSYTTRFGAASV
jgi:N-methylhydantoinase B/oxoprolinase/acetone carboxylase alpha subunit